MYRNKDSAWFEAMMGRACAESCRVVASHGTGLFVFASKETPAWEAMLAALIESGWTVTASWAIDTEMGSRLRAQHSAVLASSVHIVARPRNNTDVGDWRDVLAELPGRINDWLPRLASEGVVGADAIFACLGPALAIFSRYSRVEKPSGEAVGLKDYLEYVWAAVAKAALSMIFSGADTSALEPDARLTAMWFWTLNTSAAPGAQDGEPSDEDAEAEADAEEDENNGGGKAKATGYSLEFDAARKIAQGLGAHLEQLAKVVAVKGSVARLLSIRERIPHLFGNAAGKEPAAKPPKKPKKSSRAPVQRDFFHDVTDGGQGNLFDPTFPTATGGEGGVPQGETVLDRVHQAMILFGLGQAEAMRRFLVDDGAGRDPRFWKLAQSLSALYPPGTEEKRWVDGVLARKKGLGF